jgi:hypothetical protein
MLLRKNFAKEKDDKDRDIKKPLLKYDQKEMNKTFDTEVDDKE